MRPPIKAYKLQGKTGFTVTHDKRPAYVLQVQSLMSEALGEGCNDLADADAGVDKDGDAATRRVRMRREADNAGEPNQKKKSKSKVKMVEYKGWQWPANKKFTIEKLLGKMVAEGEVPGRQNVKVGTLLYKVLWEGFPPECATWEDESVIHDDFIDAYEAELEAEGELEAEEDDSDGDGSDAEGEP